MVSARSGLFRGLQEKARKTTLLVVAGCRCRRRKITTNITTASSGGLKSGTCTGHSAKLSALVSWTVDPVQQGVVPPSHPKITYSAAESHFSAGDQMAARMSLGEPLRINAGLLPSLCDAQEPRA